MRAAIWHRIGIRSEGQTELGVAPDWLFGPWGRTLGPWGRTLGLWGRALGHWRRTSQDAKL